CDIFELKFFSFEAHMVFGPELSDNLDAFDEPLESLCFIQLKGVELFVAIAEPEGCEGSSVIDDIQSGKLLGHRHGVAQAKKHDRGADLAVLHLGAEASQGRDLVHAL